MSKAAWIKENLKRGELYGGILLGQKNEPDRHIIILPKDVTAPWDKAIEIARDAGGELPDRFVQRLLFANARQHFKSETYWSGTQSATNDDYAWCQHFGDGNQSSYLKSYSYRVRPVRSILIIE